MPGNTPGDHQSIWQPCGLPHHTGLGGRGSRRGRSQAGGAGRERDMGEVLKPPGTRAKVLPLGKGVCEPAVERVLCLRWPGRQNYIYPHL